MDDILNKTVGLFNLIMEKPMRIQILAYLSEHFCLNGDVCGAAYSKLSSDGLIRCLLSEGYFTRDPKEMAPVSIYTDRPACRASGLPLQFNFAYILMVSCRIVDSE